MIAGRLQARGYCFGIMNCLAQTMRGILCAAVLLGQVATGQISEFESRRIVDIQFSPANILDASDLEKAQPLKKGEPLRADAVARAIDGLFATGRFQDIAVEAELASSGGVIVHFMTKPNRFVGGVSVEGKIVAPPNRGQIAGTAQLTLGAPFHDDDLNHAVEAIKGLLVANGLHKAEVTPEVERDDDAQQVFITFKITEGKRAKYETPVIRGETRLSDGAIFRATGWRIPIIHWWRQVTDARTRKGIEAILGKYQKQERLMARVDLEKLDYDAQTNRVRPNLNINPGPKVEVKAVEA